MLYQRKMRSYNNSCTIKTVCRREMYIYNNNIMYEGTLHLYYSYVLLNIIITIIL